MRQVIISRFTLFQSTPPVWGATPGPGPHHPGGAISIHAPRVGGDGALQHKHIQLPQFQSTPPVWGATPLTQRRCCAGLYFNPRPPCGGRLGPPSDAQKSTLISIHAPRVGGDFSGIGNAIGSVIFQSTPPVWGATSPGQSRTYSRLFQSTPPVWGATSPNAGLPSSSRDFNPRPPCGGRPENLGSFDRYLTFQSTPPVWGATHCLPVAERNV